MVQWIAHKSNLKSRIMYTGLWKRSKIETINRSSKRCATSRKLVEPQPPGYMAHYWNAMWEAHVVISLVWKGGESEDYKIVKFHSRHWHGCFLSLVLAIVIRYIDVASKVMNSKRCHVDLSLKWKQQTNVL